MAMLTYCVLLLVQVMHLLGGYLKEEDALHYGPQHEWQQPLDKFTSLEPRACSSCKCGKTNGKDSRIVGGEDANKNEYPWMTLIDYDGKFYCGGSLINDRYILTAAHCIQDKEKSKFVIKLLVYDRRSDDSKVITRSAESLTVHLGFNFPVAHNNDIGLILLNKPVTFNNILRPICLPHGGRSFTGHKGIAIGWGNTKEDGSLSETLMMVTLPIISNEHCQDDYGSGQKITENMLCAGYDKGGKSTCQGDSGGPLQVFNKTSSTYVVAGLTSFAEGCARPHKPSVFTRVNQYTSWIKRRTRDACYCKD